MCSQDLNSILTHLLLLLKYNTVNKYEIYWEDFVPGGFCPRGNFVRGNFVLIPLQTTQQVLARKNVQKTPFEAAEMILSPWNRQKSDEGLFFFNLNIRTLQAKFQHS